MDTAEARNDHAPTDDEIAAAVLVIHTLRQRAVPSPSHISGWRRAARAEAIGQATAHWGRKSWAR